MRIIDRVASTMQAVLRNKPNLLALETSVIKRQRKFGGSSLFMTMVLTMLKSPAPKNRDFVLTAAQLGVSVTPEAVKKRFTDELITFLRRGLEQVIENMIAADVCPTALLDKFTAVEIGDSTTVTIPDEYQDDFPGCGGKAGSGKAAVKIQAAWELRSKKLTTFLFEPGRKADAKSQALEKPAAAGSLVIRDLGYFKLDGFQALSQSGAYWISRLQQGTTVFDHEKRPLNLLEHLRRHVGNKPIDMQVRLGTEGQLACRMIVLKVPQEMADRRKQQAYEKAKKHGRTPSAEHLQWCEWTILITNCQEELLTWKEVVILYRARWQIELMFKLWKSHNHLASYRPEWTARERMALFWAKLIAVIVQHWLLLTANMDPRCSHWKAAQVVREWAALLIAAVDDIERLTSVLETMAETMSRLGKRKIKKKSPSLFQLLENPELLAWNS